MGLVQWLKGQFLCHLVICYGFFVSGLLINLLQICTLPLWPINKQLARRINCKLGYSLTSQSVALLEWWSGTEVTLYTDPENYQLYGKENAIVVLNHNFEIDFLCGWTFCERFGVLGASKCLAKKELSYLPVIGWMWYFLEMVFIKRKWEEDKSNFVQSLQNLRDYPENFWDKFQEDYSQTGCFPGPKVTPPCRPWALINWLGWTCLLLYPLCLLLVQLVNSGSILTIMATVAFCAAVSFGVRWMIGQTEIKRSSSYGVPLNNK
uniref:1-acylglycerol-3-phosphate O-acyltransferase n=1 Tax=Oncorhynchus tshawytscha TaxID=74940 RepID=A0AAZ3PKY3_ONCTS